MTVRSSSEPLKVPRLAPLDATVSVPGSKSIANRALICAALADGTSTVSNAPDGDDTTAMISCLGALGYPISTTADAIAIPGGRVGRVQPEQIRPGQIQTGQDEAGKGAELYVNAALAGTTSRFVTALAALGTQPITIDGAEPLRKRPFGPLLDALVQIGVDVTPRGVPGGLPVTVSGPPTSSVVQMRGDVSSQFVSALMMIGPYLPNGLEIQLTSPLVSRPYVDLTLDVMAAFGHDGVSVDAGDRPGHNAVIGVSPGRYRATDLRVEPDASSASYPLAMAAVAGGTVSVEGLGLRSRQGDAGFARLLAEMGCDVEQTDTHTIVRRPLSRVLTGIDVDMADISDLVPTLVAVAMFATTPTYIRGVGFIRGKESDRLGDLSDEFAHVGADIEVTDDGLIVRPAALHGGSIDPHHDHRLAMAAGVVAAAVEGVVVDDPDVVSKSWPGYWGMRAGLTAGLAQGSTAGSTAGSMEGMG